MDSTLRQFRCTITLILFFRKNLLSRRLNRSDASPQDDAIGALDAGAGRLVATMTSPAPRLR
jgi:hypothetical protein